MELVIKAAAAALTAAVAGLVISKRTPELSVLLGMTAVTVILAVGLKMLSGLTELVSAAMKVSDISPSVISPMLKCLAVAIVTKLTASLCKDSGQSACASALELTGAITALSIASPMLKSMLTLIGTLI